MNKPNLDLTTLKIQQAPPYDPRPLKDYSTSISNCDIEVIFRDHKDRLLKLIYGYSYVVGCVAWLTDLDILKAMATNMEHVSIIVQKEDFLRPDSSYSTTFYKDLRQVYDVLPSTIPRLNVDNDIMSSLSYALCPDMGSSIRCVGNHNKDRSPAFPRMHNKFLVFTNDLPIIYDFMHPLFWNIAEDDMQDIIDEIPNILGVSDDACVWTGSYNISNTATKSFENAIIIHNKDAATVYFNEWAQITALSEPLDWTSEWCEPEWRIGT